MSHTKLLFRNAAREKVLRGATQLADAIRVTLGPKSVWGVSYCKLKVARQADGQWLAQAVVDV